MRQAHPHPRLTIPAANAQLDAQIEEMQALDDELQEVNTRVGTVKEQVKAGAREVERLRIERADLEKTVSAGQKEVQDGRVVGLYDWCEMSRDYEKSAILIVTNTGIRQLWRYIARSSLWKQHIQNRRTSFTSHTRL